MVRPDQRRVSFLSRDVSSLVCHFTTRQNAELPFADMVGLPVICIDLLCSPERTRGLETGLAAHAVALIKEYLESSWSTGVLLLLFFPQTPKA